jgi:hypothetical protein
LCFGGKPSSTLQKSHDLDREVRAEQHPLLGIRDTLATLILQHARHEEVDLLRDRRDRVRIDTRGRVHQLAAVDQQIELGLKAPKIPRVGVAEDEQSTKRGCGVRIAGPVTLQNGAQRRRRAVCALVGFLVVAPVDCVRARGEPFEVIVCANRAVQVQMEFGERKPTVDHQAPSSFSTLRALSRRNFGHTDSFNGTSRMSVMMRSSERPIGK